MTNYSSVIAQTASTGASSSTQALLDKAHSLEVRGRMDLAAQTWQQVLLVDTNNVAALSGLARAAKLAGNNALAEVYLERLTKINPKDPAINRVQTMMTQQDQTAELGRAAKFAESGQYAEAMRIYRKVFGEQPPAGDWALAYYETESATNDGRVHAVAGLRSLAEKYPLDSRYQVALGRVLTYSPSTRSEGRKLLERYPNDAVAVEALRQSLLWDSQNPASAGDIRAYLMKHKDSQLAEALKNQPKREAASAPESPQDARNRVQLEAAYRALNTKRIEEAEQRFKEILTNDPDSGRALAGMGYVRMQQSNFGGAISFLEQAEQDGINDSGVENALSASRFYYDMSEGGIALNQNDLPNAEKQYLAALAIRPGSPDALEGLGGTLMKAQQPQVAVKVFERYVKVQPSASAAWRGLFLSEYEAGNLSQALQTDRQIPTAVRTELMREPEFLRSLASGYSAAGRDADAQRVLRAALDLPFPADARGVKVETQLQYAGLLQQANRLSQAAGLFRQVIAVDPGNTAAWEGLVRVEHAMKQDMQALQTLQSMPSSSYDVAMHDPGFNMTVASVYQTQNKLDMAQSILEKAIAQGTAAGQRPSVAVETQLAGVYLAENNSRQAYPIYRKILSETPEFTDAWKGLLATLHSSGRDHEVLAQVQQIPADVRRMLEDDVDYLQTMGSVYASLGEPAQSMIFLNRVKQHYAAQNTEVPPDIDIQNAYLLFNGSNDAGLYRQLMVLGGRQDLTDEQRRTVQTIWALWASRRANQAAAAGDDKKALTILNAAARAFPDNPAVLNALASGYARAGEARQAVAIFKSQDMSSASASDYRAAVGAALAANDLKSAEAWLRFGLDQYPRDSQMLILAAKFEQARGDSNRAAAYYRASLAAMPPADPGAELANALSQPAPMGATGLPSVRQPRDLASLLAPRGSEAGAGQTNDQGFDSGLLVQPAKPYLPGSADLYGAAPVQLDSGRPSQPLSIPNSGAFGNSVPSYMGNPSYQTASPARGASPTLKDYVPPPVERPDGGYVVPQQQTKPDQQHIHSRLSVLPSGQDNESGLNEQAYQKQQIRELTKRTQSANPDPQQALTYAPTSSAEKQEVYGTYVPYVPSVEAHVYSPLPVAIQPGEARPQNAPAQRAIADVLPTARYLPNAKAKRSRSSSSSPVAEIPIEKASTLESISSSGTVAQSAVQDDAVPTRNAQYVPPSAAVQQQQVPQPDLQQSIPAPNGQQYSQPGIESSKPHRVAKPYRPALGSQPGPLYPGVALPQQFQPEPSTATVARPGLPPSDDDLAARQLPPLRGGYDPFAKAAAPPMTPREQAEFDLGALESSYGAWIGGTAYARYRSGTVGFDRLTDLEATFEASVVAAKHARFTVVARPVFLSNGTIDTATLSAETGVIPVLGTLPGNATATPQQQSASGVGGEIQMTTANLGISVGYTPYEFLVSNVIGHFNWRPAGGRFSLFADRDSVKETQLSYAGMRDPGSVTPFFAGNIWGGVISTGGGARVDAGNEKAGFYVSADGASLTGYHVLSNLKFEGTMGTYFRVKNIPQYGSLNVGANFFGMHFSHNELGLTYGQGGYFSPQTYFLAAVPVTYSGHYLTKVHYLINGSVGFQTFQSNGAAFYPLDRAIETGSGNAGYPSKTSTGFNYSINSEGSYQIADHWYAGGFLSGNNTNDYNTVTGGFFVRYLFKPQFPTEEYPTGLFPIDGFRPLRVP